MHTHKGACGSEILELGKEPGVPLGSIDQVKMPFAN